MKNLTSIILNKLIIKSKQRILIPFYHAVTDDDLNYVEGLYPPRKIADFKRDLDVLLEFYKPISIDKLIDIINSGEEVSQNYFHLTFDDGLANFYEIVAPILIKRNIPATIFLNTNFVDNNDLFYRYKASLLIDKYSKSGSEIKNIYHKFLIQNGFTKINVSKNLLEINFKNRELLDLLAYKIKFSFSDFLKDVKPYLTKNQIYELIEKGFTFGAHSANHPLYYKLSIDEQLKQTKDSLAWVEDELKLDYKVFSFPFTCLKVSKSFFETLSKENILDISFGTAGIKGDVIINNLQRISFEFADINTKFFLLKEYCKYFLKIPLGKNIMKREWK